MGHDMCSKTESQQGWPGLCRDVRCARLTVMAPEWEGEAARTAVVVAADDDMLDAQHQSVLQAGHDVEVLVVDQAAQVAVHEDAPRGQIHGQIRLQHAFRILPEVAAQITKSTCLWAGRWLDWLQMHTTEHYGPVTVGCLPSVAVKEVRLMMSMQLSMQL